MADVDLNKLLTDGSVKITSTEHADERTARLRRDNVRFYVTTSIVAAALVSVFAFGLYYIFLDRAIAARSDYAEKILGPILTGGLAFLLGREVGKS